MIASTNTEAPKTKLEIVAVSANTQAFKQIVFHGIGDSADDGDVVIWVCGDAAEVERLCADLPAQFCEVSTMDDMTGVYGKPLDLRAMGFDFILPAEQEAFDARMKGLITMAHEMSAKGQLHLSA